MLTKTLSATEVKNRFGAVLKEVTRTGGPIVVERDGQPVAIILSVAEYDALQKSSNLPEASDLLLSAFGMWADRADISDDWLAEGREQWRSTWHEQ